MIAHIVFDALDPNKPATLSSILWRLLGDSVSFSSVPGRCPTVVVGAFLTVLGLPLVDGITRTFAACWMTLSFHVPFKGCR